MQGLLVGMIGMILKDYHLRTDLADALQDYEIENNCSPILVIENLLEKFLYDEGYITVDRDTVVCKTPFEIEQERRSRFVVRNKGSSKNIIYGDLDFGYFNSDEVDDIIEELLGFSDDELEGLSRNNWEYGKSKYKPFFRAKLKNPSLTCDEFMNLCRVSLSVYSSGKILISFKGKRVCSFNSKVSRDVIDEVRSFLLGLSDDELDSLIKAKDESSLTSAEFVLDYVDRHRGRKPYVLFKPNGNVMFQRGGYSFGTHDRGYLDSVWEFLDSVDWDKSYSTKVTGLKGKRYKEWLYGEMGLVV